MQYFKVCNDMQAACGTHFLERYKMGKKQVFCACNYSAALKYDSLESNILLTCTGQY